MRRTIELDRNMKIAGDLDLQEGTEGAMADSTRRTTRDTEAGVIRREEQLPIRPSFSTD